MDPHLLSSIMRKKADVLFKYLIENEVGISTSTISP